MRLNTITPQALLEAVNNLQNTVWANIKGSNDKSVLLDHGYIKEGEYCFSAMNGWNYKYSALSGPFIIIVDCD